MVKEIFLISLLMFVFVGCDQSEKKEMSNPVSQKAPCSDFVGEWNIGPNDGNGPADVYFKKDFTFEFDGWEKKSDGKWTCEIKENDDQFIALSFQTQKEYWNNAFVMFADFQSHEAKFYPSKNGSLPSATFLVKKDATSNWFNIMGYVLRYEGRLAFENMAKTY